MLQVPMEVLTACNGLGIACIFWGVTIYNSLIYLAAVLCIYVQCHTILFVYSCLCVSICSIYQ